MANKKIKCDDLQCTDNKDGFCQREYEEESDRNLRTRMIAIECKSFFRVFLDIEKHILPLWEKMRDGTVDEEAIDEHSLYHIPYVVNGAFAAELALKYLLENAGIDYAQGNKGHDLEYLFGLLFTKKKSIRADRDAVIALLCKDGTQNIETLKQNIAAWHDCYKRHRYFYAQTSVGTNGVFPLFVHTLCEYVISKSKHTKEKDEEQSEIQLQNPAIPD